VVPGEGASAHTSFSFEFAQVLGLAWALLGQNAFSLGTLDVSLLAGASDDALLGAELGWVLEVVAGQGAGGAALLELLVLTAHGFAGALLGQNAFSLGVLNVSLLALASNDALQSAELGWVVEIVAGQGAGSSAAGEFLVFATDSIG